MDSFFFFLVGRLSVCVSVCLHVSACLRREVFSGAVNKYRAALETKKNSTVFTRVEFQSMLKTIDSTVSPRKKRPPSI